MSILCFDIETIPDVAGLRTLYGAPMELSDQEIVSFVQHQHRAKKGSDFLPLHYHRVVAISCLLRYKNQVKIWSLAEPDKKENEIITRFFKGISEYTPTIVSWNGAGFDLPVLHYRSLIHGIEAARYWEMGDGNHPDAHDYRYNNYINRYHTRHTDLMDLLSLYQGRAAIPLDELAKLIGFPGKLGMDGSQVWDAWCADKKLEISNYCETDVANTFLIYTRFRKMRGEIDAQQENLEYTILREELKRLNTPHWLEFLAAWRGPL